MEKRRETERWRKHRQWNILPKRGVYTAPSAPRGQTVNAGGASGLWKLQNNLFPIGGPSAIPKVLGSHSFLFSLLCDSLRFYYRIIFIHCYWCFPYWQPPPLINVFMASLMSTNPMHKPLSKINKRRAERGGRWWWDVLGCGGGEGEGGVKDRREKIQSESHVSCWKGPWECFQSFRQYSARRPVYAIIKKETLPCLFIIRTHGWQLPVNNLCVYICVCVCV